MSIGKGSYAGSPYLGVFGRADERFALLPSSAPGEFRRLVERCLGVEVVTATVGSTEVVGSLLAFNSHGLIVPETATDAERERLGRLRPVHTVPGRINAHGNAILANDHGAVVHPDYSAEQRQEISRALKVPVAPATVAGLGTVAMAAVATNRGVVVHPRATEPEQRLLEKVLGVPCHRSTANFGIPLVGACLIANSRGMIVGDLTTPVELIHLQDGLKLYD